MWPGKICRRSQHTARELSTTNPDPRSIAIPLCERVDPVQRSLKIDVPRGIEKGGYVFTSPANVTSGCDEPTCLSGKSFFLQSYQYIYFRWFILRFKV